jgi:dimethylamine monooxygenase subunit A
VNPARPLYFPVQAQPLRMQAGLARFGTDFGNGDAYQRFFPRDDTTPRYLAEKARVLTAEPTREAFLIESPADEACVVAAQAWFSRTLRGEGHAAAAELSPPALGRALVEDFAVLRRDSTGADRVLWLHACFPSGWRPELVIGQSFTRIHAPVPAFEAVARKTSSLVEALVTRGPYVRFVWTVTADDELDHHPAHGRRRLWTATTPRGFLRVERQVTVPLPIESGCVFLIRTYLYDFAELSSEKRGVLAHALESMPPEVALYKSLTTALPRALELLR